MNLFDQLKNLISTNNDIYLSRQVTDDPDEIRKDRTIENEYATAISDFLIQNAAQLTPRECVLLDLVPYRVWAKMTAKSRLLVQMIENKLEA